MESSSSRDQTSACATDLRAAGSWANFCEQSLQTCQEWKRRAAAAGFSWSHWMQKIAGAKSKRRTGSRPFLGLCISLLCREAPSLIFGAPKRMAARRRLPCRMAAAGAFGGAQSAYIAGGSWQSTGDARQRSGCRGREPGPTLVGQAQARDAHRAVCDDLVTGNQALSRGCISLCAQSI